MDIIKIRRIIKQLIWCMFLPVIFNTFALVGNVAKRPDSFGKLFLPVLIYTIFAVFIILYLVLTIKLRNNYEYLKSAADKNEGIVKKDVYFVGLLIVAAVLLRAPMYGTFQRWDAGEYFYRIVDACYDYDFTLKGFMKSFSICSHTNYGFSGVIGSFMFIAPYSYRIINVLQITLSVLAVLCLYSVFKKTWKLPSSKAFMGALMVNMIPVFLGLSTYLSPDYFIFVFFVFALYFRSKSLHIMEGFMMILLVFCKENCAVIVFGFYSVSIIYSFIKGEKGLKNRIANVLKTPSMWVAAVTGILFMLVYFKNANSWSSDSGNAEKAFTYSRVYVIIRIKQMFFTHFTSIMTLVCLVCMFIIVFRIRKKIKEKQLLDGAFLNSLFGLMFAMAFMCAIGVIYHIAISARYDTFFVGCLAIYMIVLLSILCLHYNNRKMSAVYYVITGVLAILFMTESFVTIDPLARRWFEQLDLGRGYTIDYESEYKDYMGDSLVYNYQYSWLDKSLDAMLKDIDFDGSKAVYLPYKQFDTGSALHLAGNSRFYRVGWDDVKKERCYYRPEDTSVTKINSYYVDDYKTYFPYKDLFYDEYMDENTITDEGVYTGIKYYGGCDKYLDRLEQYFYHDPKTCVDKGCGRLEYYKVYKKDSYDDALSVGEVIDNSSYTDNPTYKQDLAVAYDILNGNYDVLKTQVDELFNYKYGLNSSIIQIGVHDRVDIRPMDSVSADFTVTDDKGNEIIRRDRMSVTVGDVGLIDEVDSALQEMEIGDSETVEYVVPENVLGLEEYAGQTVYINIYVQDILCIYENQLNQAQLVNLYNSSFDYIWNYYKNLLICDIIDKNKEAYENGITDYESEDARLSVESYMSEYLETHSFSENDFLNKYAGISPQDFEKAKVILANSKDELDQLYEKLEASYWNAPGY
ncbi:MAG: hypothetical protein K5865_03705 [Eubacterium sp.]|nr:hypothetical protein [Eubacterium sp.]